jgi:hypothetical protein
VRGGDDIGSRRVHRGVDGERGDVHTAVALHDLTAVVHEDQVGRADVRERHAEGVHPEVIEPLGVARGDVTGHALLEPEPGEESEPRGEALLAMQPGFVHRVERREIPPRVRGEIAGGKSVSHGSSVLTRSERGSGARRR